MNARKNLYREALLKSGIFIKSAPVIRLVLATCLTLILSAVLLSGCGDSQGSETGSWLYHPDSIQVFIKSSANPEQVAALQSEIGAMQEVSSVTYTSSEEAKKKLTEDLESQGLDPARVLTGKQVPASLQIKLKDEIQVTRVANRLYDKDIVDNTPGTHNGIVFGLTAGTPKPVSMNLITGGTFSVTDDTAEIMNGSYARTGDELALFSSANSQIYRGNISGDRITDLLGGFWTRQ